MTANPADFGNDADVVDLPSNWLPTAFSDAPLAFVTFLGSSNNFMSLSCSNIEDRKKRLPVAVAYSKRPGRVKNGKVICMGRLTNSNDASAFGRASGYVATVTTLNKLFTVVIAERWAR